MKRTTYTGALRFPYGFHTGDGRRLGAVDQPLFRETDGQVALSGSSLAGVLRADLERLTGGCRRAPECRCVVCRLLGPRAAGRRRQDGEDSHLAASRLHVLGGASSGPLSTRVRDRVGIDRRTRTAADRRKYDVEVVEGGVEFPFELRIDDPQEDELRALEAVLQRLAAGWLFLGGKTSSGLGRAELVRLDRAELDMTRPADLVENLLSDDPTAGAAVTPSFPPAGMRSGTCRLKETPGHSSGFGLSFTSPGASWSTTRRRPWGPASTIPTHVRRTVGPCCRAALCGAPCAAGPSRSCAPWAASRPPATSTAVERPVTRSWMRRWILTASSPSTARPAASSAAAGSPRRSGSRISFHSDPPRAPLSGRNSWPWTVSPAARQPAPSSMPS